MTAPSKKTDQHIVTQVTTGGAGSPTVHGPHIYSVVNQQTGEEVERVEGLSAALAAQAKYNARAKASGQ